MSETEPTTHEPRILDKIKKLLRLGASKDSAEAASATAMAQRLIERYRIDEALLKDEEQKPVVTREEIQKELRNEIIYNFRGRHVATWILNLSSYIARENACRVWYGANISAIGRADDVACVRYMLGYLVLEIERLAKEGLAAYKVETGFPGGKTWGNSFRLGAVSEIADRLWQARKGAEEAARSPHKARELEYAEALKQKDAEKLLALDREPVYSLIKIEAALVRVAEERRIATELVAEKMKILFPKSRGGKSRTSRRNQDGYEAGKRAGAKIDLSRNHRQLGGGS